MAAFSLAIPDKIRADSLLPAHLEKPAAILARHARMKYADTGPCQGYGLIQALASAVGLQIFRGKRLARPHHMTDPVCIIIIQRPKIQYLHRFFLLSPRCVFYLHRKISKQRSSHGTASAAVHAVSKIAVFRFQKLLPVHG